ncbi:MEDS domain-containing protein [Sporosarcina ureae]|uniref:MEDS domain-containing protein n=1 Tax=Sporosarcina ureae TaxID=1571 RepID=UPI0026F25F16|nr:MEDS domain-containing protein [Sporosarcina ureae]
MIKTSGKNREIELNKGVNPLQVGHVVYTYTDRNKYLERATSYVAEGLDKNHIILYVDRPTSYASVIENLKNIGYTEEQMDNIYFVDTDIAYKTHESFNPEAILKDLHDFFDPHVKEGNMLRGWGLVTWRPQSKKTIVPSIALHEQNFDDFFSRVANITGNYINICAYDSVSLSGSLLIELLQTHEYHMTDTNFLPSHLYKKESARFTGISKQLQFENELRNHDTRREKLDITGKLASIIAHELRTSLTVVQGRLQLLDLMANDRSEASQAQFDAIKNGLREIEQIASKFLCLAETHIVNKKVINISELIEVVKMQMRSDLDLETIDIHVKSDNTKMTIFGDELKVRQVFINLIKNAIEALETGIITVHVKDDLDHVTIDVSDNGPGIPDEIINKIGDPFMSSKVDGTGLGLLICEKVSVK